MKRKLGNISELCITSEVAYKMRTDDKVNKEILAIYNRHLANDWGETCETQRQENEEILHGEKDGSIISYYDTSIGNIVVLTVLNTKVTVIALSRQS